MPQLGPLTRVLARTRLRVRAQHALNGLAWGTLGWLTISSLYALGALLMGQTRLYPLESIGLLLLAAVVGAFWPVSLEATARRIDESHGLQDRVRAALDFAGRPVPQRSRFMAAAIQDAERWAERISPARAAPIALPKGARWVAVGMAVLALLIALPVRKPGRDAANATKARAERLLSADDLDAFRADLAELSRAQPLSRELREEQLRYQRLLDHLMRNDLGRADAIHELLALEKQLAERAEPEAGELGGLSEFAQTLAGASDVLKKALEAQDAELAASELARLAQAAASGDLRELQRLRDSLRALANKRAQSEAREARARELESLLERKEKEPPAEPEEKRLLERQRRELEKLQRQLEEQRKRNRHLDKLERDLADLSRALDQNDAQRSEQELAEAAQDLERFAEEQREREQREELSRQLSQLRQLMQQGGQRGDGDGEQQEQQGEAEGGQNGEQPPLEQTFLLRARGQSAEQGAQREQGEGESSQREQGEGAEGEQQAGASKGESARLLELQQTGQEATLLIPGAARRRELDSSRELPSREHDPRTADEASELDGKTRDSRLTGTPSRGPSRSQTILDAADRGFATTDYRKVYTEYHGHAEQVLEQDDVPAGYRFYVRRYFQLIRPRDPER